METKARLTKINVVAFLIFVFGLLVGASLLGIAAWADMESAFFDSTLNGEEPLSGLSCPLVMTTGELDDISLTIKNPLERKIKPMVRMTFSTSTFLQQTQDQQLVEVPGGESTEVTWAVSPENATFERFVMVKAYQHSYGIDIPSADATCGIFVLDAPGLTGNQIVIASLAVSVLGMGSGIGLYSYTAQQKNDKWRSAEKIRRAMTFAAAFTLIGILANIFGFTFISVLLFILVLMQVLSVLSSLVRGNADF